MRITPGNLDAFIESVRNSEPIRFSGGPLDGHAVPASLDIGKQYMHLFIEPANRELFHRGTKHTIRDDRTMLAIYERTEDGAPLILLGLSSDCKKVAESLEASGGI